MPLNTNWRDLGLTPTFYVSEKDGNDANAGTKALPKKTVPNDAGNHQLRSGLYVTPIFIIGNANQGYFGDGYVIIDGQSLLNPVLNNNVFVVVENINLKNFISPINNTTPTGGFVLNNVIIDGGDVYLANANSNNLITHLSGILRLKSIPTQSDQLVFLSRSTIISTFVCNENFDIKNTVFSSSANITVPLSGQNGNGLFQNCAFENVKQINSINFIDYTLNGDSDTIGNTYGDSERFSGTITIGLVSIAFIDCFWSANLGFNDELIQDYTLRDSPRSILWNEGNIIGAYDIGIRFLPSNAGFDPSNGATYVGVNRNTVDEKFELTASPSGVVTSSLNPVFALNFGELVTLDNALLWFGLVPPLEVVQLTKYDGVAPNPTVRLDYEINIYDESEPNGANNPANFIGWKRMEVNMPVEVDAGNLGNANQDALLDDIGAAIVNRFALRFTIREDGN